MVVDIDDPKPYESHVDISMFIRTRQQDGFIFYLGSDPFKNDVNSNQGGESGVRSAKPQIFKNENNLDNEAPGISNITCELSKGTLKVTIVQEDGKKDNFNLFSAKLSNGYRHFIRVIRQNNLMTVTVNETITINQDFPVAPTFIIEKLYLGNSPVRSNRYWADPISEINKAVEDDIFGDVSENPSIQSGQGLEVSTTSRSSSTDIDRRELSTVSTLQSTAANTQTSSTLEPSTESNIILDADEPKVSTIRSDTTTIERRQGGEEAPGNQILPKNNNRKPLKRVRPVRPPRLLEEDENESINLNDDDRQFSTAPLQSNPATSIELRPSRISAEPSLSRERREINEGNERGTRKFFKGIIQDVQITNGDKRNIRIVELFEQEFVETPKLEIPLKVGPVKVHSIKKGEISDETCNINPCKHDGVCQITWNDYRCECEKGWKGRNCEDKEFCSWYTCPGESTCVSLSDGYECLTNATFNGVSTAVVLKPENFPNSSYSSGVENTIKATFRSKYTTGGTILHIVGDKEYANKHIRISIKDQRLFLEIPEGNKMLNKSLKANVLSGDWQTVEIAFAAGGGPIIKTKLNNGEFEFFTIESTIDFASFITTSKDIILGSSSGIDEPVLNDQKDVYNAEGIDVDFESVQIHTSINGKPAFTDFFRGCIGEVRIAGVLLPFFSPTWLNEKEFPNKKKFIATYVDKNVDDTGCTLCYQNECKNDGKCMNPAEKFECDCLDGFEDPTCGTNIDECAIGNSCKNGFCKDGIANYTCECQEGWDGWL